MKRLFLLPYLFCLVFTSTTAQIAPGTIYLPHDNPPLVKMNSHEKTMAWCGGVNNPQFNLADLNRDGIKDLIIFERGHGVKTFLNVSSVQGNPVYVHKPSYEANIPLGYPGGVENWMLVRDYNNDGIMDIFCGGFPGLNILKGYYNSSNVLCFKWFKSVYYQTATGWTNVFISNIEIPGIIDIDGDGDLDVFAFEQLSAAVLTFYRCCNKEDGLPADSFRVCLKDVCWGRMRDNATKKWVLGESCVQWGNTCKTSQVTDPGNCSTMMDYDGDGDIDFFNASNAYSDIQLFINGKTGSASGRDSMVYEDTSWSSNGKHLTLPVQPVASYLNIDNDNDNDLMFSPHLEGTENYKCIAYYKNTGSSSAPSYTYQSDSFLVEDMIDIGTGSYPVLYDYNKDGKLDLFVGGEGYYQPSTLKNRTAISYYQSNSTGTVFDWVTNDFLGQFATNTKGSALTMGDIDGDGKDDLLIGKADGTIEYYKNNAASNTVQPNWQFMVTLNDQFGTLKVDIGPGGGGYATPFIYDVDGDGKKDIVSGSQGGKLIFFRNTGTVGSPSFFRVTDSLGGVGIQEAGNVYTYTAPFIGKIDNTGKTYLLIGTKNGILYKYDSINPANISKYVRIDSFYNRISVYDRASPFAADLNGDNKYELLVGNMLGGVRMYEQYFNVGIENLSFSDNGLSVYPNPASNVLNIVWKPEFAEDDVRVSLVSVTGVKVWSGAVDKKQTETQVNTESLPSGTYFCIVQSGAKRAVAPISIVK